MLLDVVQDETNYQPRRAIDTKQAADLLGTCEQTARNLYHRREVEGYKTGRTLHFYIDSLEAYRVKNGNQPPAPASLPSPRRPATNFDFDRHRRRSRGGN